MGYYIQFERRNVIIRSFVPCRYTGMKGIYVFFFSTTSRLLLAAYATVRGAHVCHTHVTPSAVRDAPDKRPLSENCPRDATCQSQSLHDARCLCRRTGFKLRGSTELLALGFQYSTLTKYHLEINNTRRRRWQIDIAGTVRIYNLKQAHKPIISYSATSFNSIINKTYISQNYTQYCMANFICYITRSWD